MRHRDDAAAILAMADALGATVLEKADLNTEDGFADTMGGICLLATRVLVSAGASEKGRRRGVELLAEHINSLMGASDEAIGPVSGRPPLNPSKVN